MAEFVRRLVANPRVRRYLSLQLLFGFGLSFLCLWVFAEIADEVGEQEWLTTVDAALANELYARATPDSTSFFLFISLFGSQIVFILTLIVAAYYAWRRYWLHLGIWLVALAGGELLNLLLKELFARARPVFDAPLVVELNYSFPSGHAMMSMIAYGMLAYFLIASVRNPIARILIVFMAALAVILIGISRLYLGVHFLSDVVAGFAAGGLWLATCIGAMQFLRQRGSGQPPFTRD